MPMKRTSQMSIYEILAIFIKESHIRRVHRNVIRPCIQFYGE